MTKTSELKEMKVNFIKLVLPYVLPYLDDYPKTDVPEILWSWIESHYTKGQQSLKVKKDR